MACAGAGIAKLGALGVIGGSWTVAWLVSTGLAGIAARAVGGGVAAVGMFGGVWGLIALVQWFDRRRQDRNRPFEAA